MASDDTIMDEMRESDEKHVGEEDEEVMGTAMGKRWGNCGQVADS